jgi:deoxyhypusine synthase
MVFGEMTITFPLLAGYVYHKGSWRDRQSRAWSTVLNTSQGRRADDQ